MKLYAPRYYNDFKCIADKCPHSCCIGWEIDVDESTFEKYKILESEYKSTIIDSISTEETPHFKLKKHDRCPHLDERGLCKIILNVGEDFLCDICREHPRFYNFTSVAEVGIGMSCPEAARLILSSSDYASFEEIGEIDSDVCSIDFDGRAEREKVYETLQISNCEYNTRLEMLYRNYSIDAGDDGQWREALSHLEYLDADHKKLFLNYSAALRPIDKNDYPERFLAYFIYRHCTEAVDADDFRDRLAFCLFCERLFASLLGYKKAETIEDVASIASIISEEIEYSEDNTYALMY